MLADVQCHIRYSVLYRLATMRAPLLLRDAEAGACRGSAQRHHKIDAFAKSFDWAPQQHLPNTLCLGTVGAVTRLYRRTCVPIRSA